MKKLLILILISSCYLNGNAQFNYLVHAGWSCSYSPNVGFQDITNRFKLEQPGIIGSFKSPHFEDGFAFGWAGSFNNKFFLGGNITFPHASSRNTDIQNDSSYLNLSMEIYKITLNYDFGLLIHESKVLTYAGISTIFGNIQYSEDGEYGFYSSMLPYIAISPFLQSIIFLSEKDKCPALIIQLYYQQSLVGATIQEMNDNLNADISPIRKNYNSTIGIKLSLAMVWRD